MFSIPKILIVDDSTMMRTVVRKSLTMAKVHVDVCVEAQNGIEALKELRSNRFDLMFCDLNMPEMTGDELIAKLTAQTLFKSPPIIVVSSEASDERVSALDQQNILGVLRKPFTPEKIVALLNEVPHFLNLTVAPCN